MNTQSLIATAGKPVADDKGVLPMHESNSTCNKRFAKLGIPQPVAARRAYRELIITTPSLGECILICPSHPATGFGDLAGQGSQRKSGAASFASSRQVQSRGAAR